MTISITIEKLLTENVVEWARIEFNAMERSLPIDLGRLRYN